METSKIPFRKGTKDVITCLLQVCTLQHASNAVVPEPSNKLEKQSDARKMMSRRPVQSLSHRNDHGGNER